MITATRSGAEQYATLFGGFFVDAFSAEAAGVNVLRRPQWRGHRCLVIADGRVCELGVLP